MSLNLNFVPPGPVAAAFMASNASVRAIMGPIGSGKTSAALMDGVFRATQQKPSIIDGVRYYKRAIVRDTYRNLEATTIPSWHSWIPSTLGDWNGSPPMSHRIRFGLADGTIVDYWVEFIALGDQRIEDVMRGWEGTDIYLNEADRLLREALIYARSRVGRYPSAAHGGPSWYGVLMDFNAPDTENWCYQDCVENPIEGLQFFRQPSGFSSSAENLQNLPAGYYDKLATGQPDWFVRRMVRNEFGYSREGQPVYPEFSDSLHVAPQDLEPVRGLPLKIGADAGLTPAAAIGQELPNGQWRILDELVAKPGAGMGPVRFAEELNWLLNNRYAGLKVGGAMADPASMFGGDKLAGETGTGNDLAWLQIVAARTNIVWRPAPTNKLSTRLDVKRVSLRRMIDGATPGYLLSPRCKVLRKGNNSAYCFRRVMVAGSERYHDEPDKNEYSHIQDAEQYLLMTGGQYAEVMGRERRGSSPVIHQTHAQED